MATKAIVSRVKNFAAEVVSCGIPLKRVVLFGSHAKNKSTQFSDIDVALVADQFIGVPSEDIKLFLKALRKNYVIQALTYNTKDFSPEKDPFVGEILNTGIEIKLD